MGRSTLSASDLARLSGHQSARRDRHCRTRSRFVIIPVRGVTNLQLRYTHPLPTEENFVQAAGAGRFVPMPVTLALSSFLHRKVESLVGTEDVSSETTNARCFYERQAF
jgi:hypothetical protein